MRLAALLFAVLACSSQERGARTTDSPASADSGQSGPPPQAPAKGGPAAGGDGCHADTDCTLTFLPSVEPGKAEECCVWVCERRVESKKRADALQAAWTRTCSAVRCQQYDCPASIDPVPVCRDGRCVARELR